MALLRARFLEQVRPCLEHREARLRRAALVALGFLDDGESLDAMKQRLRDPNQTVCDVAVLAIGMLNRREAVHCLLHLARGSTEGARLIGQSSVPVYTRGFAVASLALSRGPGAEAVLRSLAEDRSASPDVQALAVSGLGILATEDDTDFLMRFVQQGEAHPWVLSAALASLAESGAPVAHSLLRRSLRADPKAIRQSAAMGIGNERAADAEEIVRELWLTFNNSRDQALQGFALLSMGRIGGEKAVELLRRTVTRERGEKAAWACLALGFALRAGAPGHEEEGRRLGKLLRSHGNASVRGAAAVALGLAKPTGARKALLQVLEEESVPVVRGYLATALGMIGGPGVPEALRRRLDEDPLPQVRTRAAASLAMLRDKEAVPLLLDLLFRSSSDAVKSFAALSLGFMGEVEIVQEVLRRLENGEGMDALTRAHAIRLAARLLSGRTAPYLEPLARGSNFASEFPLRGYLLDFGI